MHNSLFLFYIILLIVVQTTIVSTNSVNNNIHGKLLVPAATVKADVIVYGATPGGIAAAISAAKHNTSHVVYIIEPSADVGGMSYAGGIGLRDLGNESTIANSVAYEWIMTNAKAYGKTYAVYQPDMDVARNSFIQMLTKYNVHTMYFTSLLEKGGVQKTGTVITSITTSTNGTIQTQWVAPVFVDASYEGDLARFAGASYTYGREAVAEYNETYAGVRGYSPTGNFPTTYPVVVTVTNTSSDLIPFIDTMPLAPVGSADKRMMGYSYRLCITPTVKKQAPFFAPPNYNRDDFVLLQRYIQSFIKTWNHDPTLGEIVDILYYRNYPDGDKYDMCDSAGTAYTSDAINLNKGYPDASYERRLEIAKQTYYYVLGLVYYLATDKESPEATRNSTLKYGLCNDQWPENKHIPPQMYVREGLRIVGDRVVTQHDFVGGANKPDSIAVGSWFYDVHVVSRTPVKDSKTGLLVANNEGQLVSNIAGKGNSYDIPIGILFPKKAELTNLIVPVCHSATHVAYSSLRVEPTFMALGQSAGLVASLAVSGSKSVQDVEVGDVQAQLAKWGIMYHCA